MRKLILLISTLILVIVLTGCFHRKGPSGPVNLTFYGLDDSDVFEKIINDYHDNHKRVNIKYKKFNDPAEFENLVVNEIAEGEGPDIFYVHNTWLPRHSKKLTPLQSETFTPKIFTDTFVNVATQDFIQPDPADGVQKIYALPLYVDTLGLYYNKRTFEQKLPERGKPAPTWDLIKEEAAKLREQQDGALTGGAIALGRSDNIRLAPDILYNLFLQAGVAFYDKDFKRVQFAGSGRELFDYFLSFARPSNKNYSWSAESVDINQPLGEVEAFLSGKVAAIAGYADLYPRLENDLKNVKTRSDSVISLSDIAVMPFPQISIEPSEYKVWANYYGIGVSRNSKFATEAWDFIQFLTSQKSNRLYHEKTKRPTGRRDLIEEQKAKPNIDVFVSQLGYAGSFRIFSDQKFSQFLREAVTAAIGGQTSAEALGFAQDKMNELLKVEAPEGLYPKPKGKKKSSS